MRKLLHFLRWTLPSTFFYATYPVIDRLMGFSYRAMWGERKCGWRCDECPFIMRAVCDLWQLATAYSAIYCWERMFREVSSREGS